MRRDRLSTVLNNGRDIPLTLVSAPAGSGKTTLLSAWLAECSCPSAWVTLDEGDADLSVFLLYFVSALRTIVPDACAGTMALLRAPELPPPATIAGLVVNEIDSLAGDPAGGPGNYFILVLDDFHLARSQPVTTFLEELLRYPPPAMRLVLSTRSDPALPLPVLRARGKVLEIRRQEVRFTLEEATAFLRQALAGNVSEELAAALEERTEGWIAGLRLAALSLRYEPEASRLLAGSEESNRFTTDFLMDEVLSQQAPAVQEFLLQTSILDRLSGPLCEAVMGGNPTAGEGQAYLKRLEAENLFVTALDGQGRWFRYHQLFRQLLRSRLQDLYSEDVIHSLHRRASAWFAGAGQVEEAIRHALAAEDGDRVVQIVEAHRHRAMNQEHWQQLNQWLHLLSRRLVEEHAELLLLEAWIMQHRWRFNDLPQFLDRIDVVMAEKPPPEPARTYLRGEIDALRSMLAYYTHQGERTYAYAEAALRALPMEASSARGAAWLYHAAGLHLQGDVRMGRESLHEALKEDRLHANSFASRLLIGLSVFDWIAGDMPALQQTASHFLRLGIERDLTESITWAHCWRGCALYQLNDLSGAEADFATVVAQRYVAHSNPYSQAAFGLASVYAARGALDRAQALVESLVAYGLEMQNMRVLSDARAYLAYLALQQGRLAEAQHWAAKYTLPLPPLVTFYAAHISLAKVHLAGGPGSRAAAVAVLDLLEGLANTSHNVRYLVELRALRALLLDQNGDRDAALAMLEQSVVLAQPGGMVRVFVDLGSRMGTLLSLLRQRGVAVSYIDRLLQAYKAGAEPMAAPVPAAKRPRLVEPLTAREMDVLELLAQRLTDKEIAAKLYVSERTVMNHAANIYQKLGVGNRREAAAAALALGILPSPGGPGAI